MELSTRLAPLETLSGGGCSRKFHLRELKRNHLSRLIEQDARVVLSIEDFDDAGAYQLTDEITLVQSVDVIASLPVEPSDFGAICAAHCLSDVFAKGAVPFCATNILFYSLSPYQPDILNAILSGLKETLHAAHVALIGGHTINNPTLFLGLNVTGSVAKDQIVRKTGARVGDVLLLTKPLGTGVLGLGVRQGALGAYPREAVLGMSALNDLILGLPDRSWVRAATDVSGAGLLGSLYELASQNALTIELRAGAVPCYPAALDLAEVMEEDGALANRAYVADLLTFDGAVDAARRNLLFDPQTSGGLLLAVEPDAAEQLVERYSSGELVRPRVIGQVVGQGAGVHVRL